MSELLLPPGKPDPLADFCQSVFAKHSEQWPISEDTLAEGFLAFARLHFLPGLEEVSGVCRDRLEISVCHTALPDGLRGLNLSYGNKREILISTNQDYHGATLHTLLHELREILEGEFRAMEQPLASDENDDIERRAEEFATLVQVSAAKHALPVVWESASKIERKWLRIGAYVLICFGVLAYAVSCTSITRIEDSLAAQRSRLK